MPNAHAKYKIRWGAKDIKAELSLWWDEEIRATQWDTPNFIRTYDKASGSGKGYAAQKKRHFLERGLFPAETLHGAYSGKKKPSLVIEFQPKDFGSRYTSLPVSLSDQERSAIVSKPFLSLEESLSLLTGTKTVHIQHPRIGWTANLSGVVIDLHESGGGYWAVARYSGNKIAGASGDTRHQCLHNLFAQPTWYFHRPSASWVGLAWLFRSINIRFPLTRTPLPKQYVKTISLTHVKGQGYLRWEQLKR